MLGPLSGTSLEGDVQQVPTRPRVARASAAVCIVLLDNLCYAIMLPGWKSAFLTGLLPGKHRNRPSAGHHDGTVALSGRP